MKLKFSIRQGLKKDIPEIVDFNLKMAKETEDIVLNGENLKKGVTAVFSDKSKGTYYVAEDVSSKELLGSCMITKEWSDWNNQDYWYLQSVFVRKKSRCQGVFKGLFNHVVELCKKKKIPSLRLYVDQDNDAAQKCYSKLGMKSNHYKFFEMNFEKMMEKKKK